MKAGEDNSGMILLAAAAAAAYYFFVMRKDPVPAAASGVIVDGTGQAVTPPANSAAAAFFAQGDQRVPVGSAIVGVGYAFSGIYRVVSLGTGGLTCLHHGGTCGDAASVYAPKGTVVLNTRDGSTYTLGG